jgi:hypothetical protein
MEYLGDQICDEGTAKHSGLIRLNALRERGFLMKFPRIRFADICDLYHPKFGHASVSAMGLVVIRRRGDCDLVFEATDEGQAAFERWLAGVSIHWFTKVRREYGIMLLPIAGVMVWIVWSLVQRFD